MLYCVFSGLLRPLTKRNETTTSARDGHTGSSAVGASHAGKKSDIEMRNQPQVTDLSSKAA